MAELIETVGLTRHYQVGGQTVVALSDVSVRIARGEFVAIMGPSGSGKSTCMHLLGCLQTPTSGRYLFDGLDVTTLNGDRLAKVRNARIGFVFQSFQLQPQSSALDNVSMPLVYAGVPRGHRDALARDALERVGLGERASHRATQLSGGEMQRVAIARAIVNGPDLLLADEPTGALDSRTGEEIIDLFAGLNEAGTTVVLVTHDEQVARAARRMLRFKDGALIGDEALC
jgi:putative ABC transport system ATP-binding protein